MSERDSAGERERQGAGERIRSLPCKVLIKVSASLHRSISKDPCRVTVKHRACGGLCRSVFLCNIHLLAHALVYTVAFDLGAQKQLGPASCHLMSRVEELERRSSTLSKHSCQ